MKGFWFKIKNFFGNVWYAIRLAGSALWVPWQKKAPHKWVMTKPIIRKRTRVYAICARCGAKR